MKKGLLLFIVIVLVLIIAKIAYSQYCASKPKGCHQEAYEDKFLTDDHMDN